MAPFITASEEDQEAFGIPDECEFCHDGTVPAALWAGRRYVVVCFECATRVLPNLIADAAANERLAEPAARALWEDATKRFWRVFFERSQRLDDRDSAV